MARKTNRADDLLYTLTEEQAASGVTTVSEWLTHLGLPRPSVKALLQEKLIRCNEEKAVPYRPVVAGDTLRLQFPKERIDYEAVEGPLTVLWEDEDVLVVDKPAGVTVNSAGQISMANYIAAYFAATKTKRKIRFLNRLDRDTTGCLWIAKSALAQAWYQSQPAEKCYEATVRGQLTGSGLLELPMKLADDGIHRIVADDGVLTKTAYEVIQPGETESVVRVQLLTGKTHQIRVAMAYFGHPLVGDGLYGTPDGQALALRAKVLQFTSLRTGECVRVEAP